MFPRRKISDRTLVGSHPLRQHVPVESCGPLADARLGFEKGCVAIRLAQLHYNAAIPDALSSRKTRISSHRYRQCIDDSSYPSRQVLPAWPD